MLKLAIEPRTIQHACFERHESFVRCISSFFKTASCDDKNMGSYGAQQAFFGTRDLLLYLDKNVL